GRRANLSGQLGLHRPRAVLVGGAIGSPVDSGYVEFSGIFHRRITMGDSARVAHLAYPMTEPERYPAGIDTLLFRKRLSAQRHSSLLAPPSGDGRQFGGGALFPPSTA